MAKISCFFVLFICSTNLFGQNEHKRLDNILRHSYPEGSNNEGKYVYYSSPDAIKQIYNPNIQKVIPNYSFYEVDMTHFLGIHKNKISCLILFNPATSTIILGEPLWYTNTVSKNVLKLFIGKQFKDSAELVEFSKGSHDLITVGSSSLEMEGPLYSEKKVTFYLIDYPGSVQRNIWLHFTIEIEINKIKCFSWTCESPIIDSVCDHS